MYKTKSMAGGANVKPRGKTSDKVKPKPKTK